MKALEKIVEAKENMNIGYIEWANDYIDEAIAELKALQPRSCDGCAKFDVGSHGICPIAEPLIRQCLSYDSSTFCCNRYVPKEQL